jgi:surface antigen Omp85-like protein
MQNTLFSLFLFISVCLLPNQLLAQDISSGGNRERSDDDFKFLPLPYLSYDRSLGFQFGALPMALYNLSKKDTISPSSISGGLGMYTTNKSYFILQFNKLYLAEDRYRATLAAGKGDINFQFFLDLPIDAGYIDFNTEATFFKIELQRRILKGLYFGINYVNIKTVTVFGIGTGAEQVDNRQGLGTVVSLDKRDNVYYPRENFITNFNFNSFPESFGNNTASKKLTLDYNHYFGLKNERDIIAVRFYGGMGLGDLAFTQQFVVGNNDIRGYTQGKYRGEQTMAIQGEYRLNPWDKIGLVGFAGFASVYNGINEADNGRILPSIGVGFRYNVFPKNHMNIGLDVAAGDGDWGIYFRIGEAF